MKYTKASALFVSLFACLFLISFASAQQFLQFIPSNGLSVSGVAGQTISLNFNVTYTGMSPTVSLTWTHSSSSGTITNPTITSINQNDNLAVSASLAIPSTSSGTITAQINATSSSGGNPASLPITITVTQPASNPILAPLTISPTSVKSNENATITVTNTGASGIVTMSETTNFGLSFTPQSFTLGTTTQTVTATLLNSNNLKFGPNTVGVKATSGSQVSTGSYTVRKGFCTAAVQSNNISIEGASWKNNGKGEDNAWELLDEIEVQVDVKNNNPNRDVDAVVKLGLFDQSGKDVANDLIFLADSDSSDEKIDININDDDEETVTFLFLVPADLNVEDYKLAVKAYDDRGESRACDDTNTDFYGAEGLFQNIQIEQASDKDRYVVVDSISLPDQVSCGETVNGKFTVYNIGQDDQDRVKITARNKAFGYEQTFEIPKGLNTGDDKTFDFSFNVPLDAENKVQTVQFFTQYDYKKGIYKRESGDDFTGTFSVIGCSSQGSNSGSNDNINTVISADLASSALPGQDLIIKTTITNTGSNKTQYVITFKDYADWATVQDVSDGSFSLNAGDSKVVTLTLKVKDTAKGAQTLNVQAASRGKVDTQEVEVNLDSPKSSGFSFDFAGNTWIWIVGAVNVLLIILIIIVAVRVSRR